MTSAGVSTSGNVRGLRLKLKFNFKPNSFFKISLYKKAKAFSASDCVADDTFCG